MSRAPPPHADIPRNLSCISDLYEKAYRARQPAGPGEESEEEGEGAGGTEGRGRQAGTRSRDRGRRARSLPARAEAGWEEEEEEEGEGAGRGGARSRSPDTCKRVRFADCLGLELAAVCRYSHWEAPRVPPHVQDQLHRDAIRQFGAGRQDLAFKDPGQARPLEPTFANPISSSDFLQKVRRDKVCLEGVEVERFRLRGTVRVLNLAFSKEVTVRHTADDWSTYTDTPARYIPGSADLHTDRFAFELALPPYLTGRALQLAVRYRVGLDVYWDNDGGRNYCLQPTQAAPGASPPPAEYCPGWIHFV
ncbi:protein phosphatase 1 regulatory subunit 3E-like [Mobula hypostoma]|uniref:protein phosphatase 1 regulatory subunit 3E-like n=1 Tax=Mobula hypostoma TaxID=723540 RepID=UPI002FC36C71